LLLIVLTGAVIYLALYRRPAPSGANQEVNNPGGGQSQNLPTSCVNEPGGKAVITSLSSYSGPVGTKLEIRGCNFAGFEGDKNAWIENSEGIKGILHGEEGSTENLMKVTLSSPLCQHDISYSGLPCGAYLSLTPGTYKIYAAPWGPSTLSNVVNFTIQ
jgi:hypothetical protein